MKPLIAITVVLLALIGISLCPCCRTQPRPVGWR